MLLQFYNIGLAVEHNKRDLLHIYGPFLTGKKLYTQPIFPRPVRHTANTTSNAHLVNYKQSVNGLDLAPPGTLNLITLLLEWGVP